MLPSLLHQNGQYVELKCDPSDDAIGAVLGQHIKKVIHTIYYPSKTMNEGHVNYTTTEKK